MLIFVIGSQANVNAKCVADSIKRLCVAQQAKRPSFFTTGHGATSACIEKIASANGLSCIQLLPNWKRDKNRAGYVRNEEAIAQCDALLVIGELDAPSVTHAVRYAQERHVLTIMCDAG